MQVSGFLLVQLVFLVIAVMRGQGKWACIAFGAMLSAGFFSGMQMTPDNAGAQIQVLAVGDVILTGVLIILAIKGRPKREEEY